ncbi:hypothetical protein EDC19_1782 [Natranaerovirga hydrolytica]|uniref:Uncharacterized protein n=1 Tax=Natranaerovirga hydrolytica TaxID=680378 RepID=A0A4V2Q072_9FIRM|nr:hypothetical protein [Natranaerovirga hydrolytica]TCK92631.1 hypothetical protein EDC19_1782 [Natranaerovirga hydrolytica]
MVDTLLKPRNIIFATILYCALLFSSHAIFAGSAWSPEGYFSVYGYNYSNKSFISTSSSTYNGWTWLGASNKMPPAGYMGAQTRIYNDANDALVASSTMTYSTQDAWSMGSDGCFRSVSFGSYYSKGLTRVYNGNGYESYNSFQSPTQTVK